MKGEARILIAVPADELWSMVTDVTRMPEWSPETYRARWLGDATGPEVGAKFRGWNKHGFLRWFTNPKVIESEPGQAFGFDTGSTRWRYQFNEQPGGMTEVVESFETRPVPGYDAVLKLFRRQEQLEEGARQTLQRIKQAAERG
jgi:uncharacterized membrane protein